ncbi:hypothetical protein ACH5RR_039743 [Cinchona calisaya]|uniref:Neprosin PEP catalytic domain-containing protein n=1 Tax=Cinchona calisaya TaxID=153742 RepID=A0ABD2Y4B1_9GENT
MVPGFSSVVHGIFTSFKTMQEIVSTISAHVFGMVKDSCLDEVGVCVLDGRMGRLTPGARARNLFDCIRSSREIGYFFGFLDSMGEVDEEKDEAVVHAEGHAYIGAKGDIYVWNPRVELDDEYTTSQVALKNGPRHAFMKKLKEDGLSITLAVIGNGVSSSNQNSSPNFAVITIHSEDGDVIDCIDIYKQPAFNHPALRDHEIQMTPTFDPTTLTKTEKETSEASKKGKEDSYITAAQIWRKSGSCPEGTVPIRRNSRKSERKAIPVDNFARRKPSVFPHQSKENKNLNLLQPNHSLAVLLTEGYAYYGAKGDIQVWNPPVEWVDEYSSSQVALKIGPHNQYEAVEAGWAVNPGVYGDRLTRVFAYWTIDGSVNTGCFDATCPGFVYVGNEISLGAAIYPISNLTGLPSVISIFINKDRITGNWWLTFAGNVNVGYWPAKIFNALAYQADTVQWGGEVYSTRVGTHPHTATGMGSGGYAVSGLSDTGFINRMRVVQSAVTKFPDWVKAYSDEYDCYSTFYNWESMAEPEFHYGGPGRSSRCP